MAAIVITGFSAVAWMVALQRMDPHRARKRLDRSMAILFVLGMLSAAPAYVLSSIFPADPATARPGLSLLLFVFVCAPVEELSKLLVFSILVARLRSLREPADGVYQAAAVGLGFAFVENVLYGAWYGPGTALLRATITPLRQGPAHAPGSCRGAPRRASRLPGARLLELPCHDRVRRPVAVRGGHDRLRAAHFRIRGGDPNHAVAHLERFLSVKPGDPYAVGLMGAALVLSGSRKEGEEALVRGQAAMPVQTRRVFRRNLDRLLSPSAAVIWYARGFDLSESEQRQYRARGELDARVRAAAWKLLPQLAHRQHLPGGHCGLLVWHGEGCASRKAGECDCPVHVELDLPGKN